jgi:hypothetical protein
MSDDYHRPTLTFPTGAYNATQVRLYGLAADVGISIPGAPTPIGGTGVNIEADPKNAITPEQVASFKDILEKYKTPKERLSIIYGDARIEVNNIPPIPIRVSYTFKIDIKNFGTAVVTATGTTFLLGTTPVDKTSCGIIVGYAYEGHTYDLPKPKIMLIPNFPESSIPADDSDYKLKEPEGYAVWIVDKLDQCVEFEMNQGFVEQIVLDANLPGKRSPTMYASKMMMAHRSGKLSD